ncbi:magnesium transporter protection protein MgtU [Klebsiella africana]|nr:magnesium transporter protection protein MgtU [Klebsiella africana]
MRRGSLDKAFIQTAIIVIIIILLTIWVR